MEPDAHEKSAVTGLADRIARSRKTDVIFHSGPLVRGADTLLIEKCIARRRRKNVLLILVTSGGEPDAAYRVARCLQTKYERFALYAPGYCKSAGTLVAAGAHDLVMSDHGEFGPLDVQMSKKDDLLERQSGLTVTDTLTTLQDNAFVAFENFFLEITAHGGKNISLDMAMRTATNMTVGLFGPLYGKIDPLRVGEANRAMRIALNYGTQLLDTGRNITRENLQFVIYGYPSHGFVIDRSEALGLFERVREPTREEANLAAELGLSSRWPGGGEEGSSTWNFEFLSSEERLEDTQPQQGGDDVAKLKGAPPPGSAEHVEKTAGKPAKPEGDPISAPKPVARGGGA